MRRSRLHRNFRVAVYAQRSHVQFFKNHAIICHTKGRHSYAHSFEWIAIEKISCVELNHYVLIHSMHRVKKLVQKKIPKKAVSNKMSSRVICLKHMLVAARRDFNDELNRTRFLKCIGICTHSKLREKESRNWVKLECEVLYAWASIAIVVCSLCALSFCSAGAGDLSQCSVCRRVWVCFGLVSVSFDLLPFHLMYVSTRAIWVKFVRSVC